MSLCVYILSCTITFFILVNKLIKFTTFTIMGFTCIEYRITNNRYVGKWQKESSKRKNKMMTF